MQRIGQIDGLRFLAFALVYFYHIKILNSGFIGVDIFFTISGFIISKILIENYHANLKYFFLFIYGRLLKLLPLILICCFITYIFAFFFFSTRRVNIFIE